MTNILTQAETGLQCPWKKSSVITNILTQAETGYGVTVPLEKELSHY